MPRSRAGISGTRSADALRWPLEASDKPGLFPAKIEVSMERPGRPASMGVERYIINGFPAVPPRCV
jgi:hypothetical protein